jgi:hypothetical protein
MMPIDLTDFEDQDLIPDGTIAPVHLSVKFGDGTDGVLARSKSGDTESIALKSTVLGGPFVRRVVWDNVTVLSHTDSAKGIADRGLALLKGIVNSARNLDPSDKSPATRAKRTVEFRDFDGMRPQIEIGVRPAQNNYPAKNFIKRAITRDMPGYEPPDPTSAGPGPGPAPAPTPAVAPISKPSWAS